MKTVSIKKEPQKRPLGLYKPKNYLIKCQISSFFIITWTAKIYSGVPNALLCEITILLKNLKSIPQGVPKNDDHFQN